MLTIPWQWGLPSSTTCIDFACLFLTTCTISFSLCRTKTPGPGAQSALRALARSGMKIGRIGELLLVPRLKLEAYDYSCYTLISFAFALVTATWWQFHGNEALSSQNLFVTNLLKVISYLYKIFFTFQRTLLLFLLTARVEREVVVDGDCNKLFTWCFFYLIGKPVASFTSNKMNASHSESYVVFIVMSTYSTLWEKINAIRNNSHKWNGWNKIRIVFKKNATEQNIVCNIFHGSIMLYTGVPHKAMSWLRYRSSSRDELAGRALKSNLQHTFTLSR